MPWGELIKEGRERMADEIHTHTAQNANEAEEEQHEMHHA